MTQSFSPTRILDGTLLDDSTVNEVENTRATSFHAVVDRILSLTRISTAKDSRLNLEEVRQKLQEVRRESFQGDHQSLPGDLRIKVQREYIIQQSLRCLTSVPSVELLASRLIVTFEGEPGVDQGGLARDWFDGLGRALAEAAESENGILKLLPDRTVGPRPGKPHEMKKADLLAIGRLAGLAVWFGIPCPLPSSRVACKLLLGDPINTKDVRAVDPEFYQYRIKPVLKVGGVAAVEAALGGEHLVFVSAPTETRPSKNLCPGGADRRVTEENKQEYLKLLCNHHLCGDMEEQISLLLQGFWEICPKDDLICTGITHRDLALLISGYPNVDVAEWRSHAIVVGPEEDLVNVLPVIDWFWEIVSDMPVEERIKLLHFATGSSRLPPTGFEGMHPRCKISVLNHHLEKLPHAATCTRHLFLRNYSNKEVLADKLRLALANDEGFGSA